MNKKLWIAAVVAGLGISGAARAHEHEGGAAGTPAAVEGEIVDMACYMGHAAKGGKHAQCAKQCVANGAPMGLLKADGNVLLLVNDHEQEQAYSDAKELAGGKAKITGHLSKRGGLTALVVEKAEKPGGGEGK